MSVVYVARQPIYDRSMKVVAYELLYRNGSGNAAGQMDAQLSAKAVLNSLIEVGLDRLVGTRTAFINLDKDLLLSPHIRALPKDNLVLEILEDIEPDDESAEVVRSLCTDGYQLALDDFIYREEMRRFLPYSRIVKVDVLALSREQISEHVRKLKNPQTKLLAEKVETKQMFAYCSRLGFDFFQGYFFCKPEVLQGREMPANKVAVLMLLAKLQDPKIGLDELERIVSMDVSLSYKLLRLINSAYSGLRSEVSSIKQAMLLLGTQTVGSLASLILMAGTTNKPPELMAMAGIRAKMCETIAAALGKKDREKFFLVGLFSVLDAVFDLPMEKVLIRLPLSADVKQALLGRGDETELTQVLSWVKAYEKGDFEGALPAPALGEALANAYVEAVEWSRGLTPAIAA